MKQNIMVPLDKFLELIAKTGLCISKAEVLTDAEAVLDKVLSSIEGDHFDITERVKKLEEAVFCDRCEVCCAETDDDDDDDCESTERDLLSAINKYAKERLANEKEIQNIMERAENIIQKMLDDNGYESEDIDISFKTRKKD